MEYAEMLLGHLLLRTFGVVYIHLILWSTQLKYIQDFDSPVAFIIQLPKVKALHSEDVNLQVVYGNILFTPKVVISL
jgi:hypothetical protein